MSTVVVKETAQVALGTPLRLRYGILDKSTRETIDMTAYTVKSCLKKERDETATYLVDPVSGTTGDGYVETTMTASSMETDDVIAAAGSTVWAETVTYLSGDVIDRIQQRVMILPRVTVPEPEPEPVP